MSSPELPTPATKPRSRCAAFPTSRACRPRIFGPLASGHINVDMIVQNVSEDGSRTDMTFTVPDTRRREGAQDPRRRARADRLPGAAERQGPGQGFGHRHRHAQPCRRCRNGICGAGLKGHQHSRHHHVRDQVFSPDRRAITRNLRCVRFIPYTASTRNKFPEKAPGSVLSLELGSGLPGRNSFGISGHAPGRRAV